MIAGFENEAATFYVQDQVGTQEDPYGEETPVYDWVAKYENVPVRAEQRDAEYVTEVHGEWPQEIYRIFVDPLDIGVADTGFGEDFGDAFGGVEGYQLGIAADDRVELSGVTGRFKIHPPNLQRLDRAVPEVVQLEVTRIGD